MKAAMVQPVLGIRHGYSGYIHGGCRCETCTDGQRRYMREMRQKHPEMRRRNAEQANARGRALERLGRLHPDELADLLIVELGRAPMKQGRRAEHD